MNEKVKDLSRVSVIIPSYEPDEKLIPTLGGLLSGGFSDIILVNDGSSGACDEIFARAAEMSGVTLLAHEKNRGKGEALKTAFAYVSSERPDSLGAVTADGDGQHLVKDITACVEKMLETGSCVLGCRDFTAPDVPERSRKGNNITRKVFRRFFKVDVSDTQTGLRAIPAEYYGAMLATDGSRYEYENNMLITLRDREIPFCEVKIDTVYIDGNETSHFRPVRDSLRIYYHLFQKMIKYAASSLSCVLIENVIQTLLHGFLIREPLSTFLVEFLDFLPARFIASLVNYFLNRKFVFQKKASGGYFAKYALLWVIQAFVTWILTTSSEILLGGTDGVLYFAIISVIKTAIFFASYKVQSQWVFKEGK